MSIQETFKSLTFQEKNELLDNLGLNSQVELICLFINDSDADIRAKTLEIMSRFGFVEYLVYKLSDESESVRLTIARECGKHKMIPELKVLVNDCCCAVSEEAIQQLGRLGFHIELVELGNKTNNSYLKIRINNELKRNY